MELRFTLDQIDEAAQNFWKQAGPHRVFAFHAPMGTGKTTFIAALCRAMGVVSPGSSPSFALVNEYATAAGEPVYHADLYRLRSEAEGHEAGLEEIFHSGQICLVEWPEKAPGLLPPDALHLQLEILSDSGSSLDQGTRYLRTFTTAS